ncbi:MAG TPA: PaaI family thioesterase [Alphaproteobacteria bacterium]|nr:PaaI family thioesterase [Alphaproteobacteria bacterium]
MATFTPLDPDYAARVRGSFARQAVMAFIGAELADVRPGYCEIRLRHRPELTQQHGYVHGGIVGTIGDSAGGYAAFTLMPADAAVLTVEYKLNLIAPADGELLIARGRVVKPGRTLTVAQFEVAAVKGGIERITATALQTLMCLAGRPDTPALRG